MSGIKQKTPAVFLDRDGTVCEEVGYLRNPKDLCLIPGSAEAIKSINSRGWKAIIISNQSGIARGYMTVDEVERVNQTLLEMLVREGARIDQLYYCPHHPAGNPPYDIECTCRKPASGMLRKAERELNIDLSRSVVIGDKLTDVETARRLNIPGILVRTGFGEQEKKLISAEHDREPVYLARDLAEAVRWWIQQR